MVSLRTSVNVPDEFIPVLKEGSDVNITIEGQSSLDGNATTNLKLNAGRQGKVLYGVARYTTGKLNAIGYGNAKPLLWENTNEAHLLNKKVEVKLDR
ncbi:MAG TPA: hypothetical protein VM935_08740 [Chitinophagaceae bacterium]|nr:hypothetical protein [Chitinophagaceae bacterium]